MQISFQKIIILITTNKYNIFIFLEIKDKHMYIALLFTFSSRRL